MQTVIETLQQRGLLQTLTDEQLRHAAKTPLKVYCGFDPSSDGLHLGNLIPIMGLAWFQKFGHTPFIIIGGATGMIGDPSGKSKERSLLSASEVEHNVAGIRKDLEKVLDFSCPNAAKILNNYDWFREMSVIDYLRNIGPYFRIGPMLAKEVVKGRMESEDGISYTEFSYQVLQGYDFLHLYKHHGITVELGGSDQWGNITAGTDLVRKALGKTVFGMTFPLLMRSDGKKFGKSEEGAVWLSSEKLSPYNFYQYFMRLPDADVVPLMKRVTFMDMEEIEGFERKFKEGTLPAYEGQKRLALEATLLIHGQEGVDSALRVTQAARPGAETALDLATLDAIAGEMPGCDMARSGVEGTPLIEMLVHAGLSPSKGEARRAIRGGGVYVNNVKIDNEGYAIAATDLIGGRFLVLAIGKKNKKLVKFV